MPTNRSGNVFLTFFNLLVAVTTLYWPPQCRAAEPQDASRIDRTWDLTPPVREPGYQSEPRYALMVFGEKREQRVWMILDGTTLYVDCNSNGDLTEPGERLEPNNPTDGGNKFSGSGAHTHWDGFNFTIRAGATGTAQFQLNHWIRAENFTPTTEFEKKTFAQRRELRYENSTLWRKSGLGRGQTPLLFMPDPTDAQVCAFDAPLTFVLKDPLYQTLKRGASASDLALQIAVLGRSPRGIERQLYTPVRTDEVPEGAYLDVTVDYPSAASAKVPLRLNYSLRQRC